MNSYNILNKIILNRKVYILGAHNKKLYIIMHYIMSNEPTYVKIK